jgi:hypothetical protein
MVRQGLPLISATNRFMLPGATYQELIQKGTATQYSAPVTAPGNPSFATIKKYVIGNWFGQNGSGYQQDYPNDTYMLRLATYSTYAEAAVLEGNVDGTAQSYFNAVHQRAGLDVTHTIYYARSPKSLGL